MKRLFVLLLSVYILFGIAQVHAKIIDFEDLSLDIESYWNGSDGSGGFNSHGVFFNNNYDMTWESWDGFSYSNRTDTEISDWENAQYNAIPGKGAAESNTYVIGYYSTFTQIPPTIILNKEYIIKEAYFTNNNYAYYSMLNGDPFAKQFEDGDWFKLTVTGKDADGDVTGSVDIMLAEGTNIVNTWIRTDLSSLGRVKSLEFTLFSSDTGEWGMNTPAYFCMDNLSIFSPSATNNSSTSSTIFPTYPGIYPFGFSSGSLNNSLYPGGAFSLYAFPSSLGAYSLIGQGIPYINMPSGMLRPDYSGMIGYFGSNINNNYNSGNPYFGSSNIYSFPGLGNSYLFQPGGGQFFGNSYIGYPVTNLFYGYAGTNPFGGLLYIR
jgi:hypothetical protein